MADFTLQKKYDKRNIPCFFVYLNFDCQKELVPLEIDCLQYKF